jgi:hypothetical protein
VLFRATAGAASVGRADGFVDSGVAGLCSGFPDPSASAPINVSKPRHRISTPALITLAFCPVESRDHPLSFGAPPHV